MSLEIGRFFPSPSAASAPGTRAVDPPALAVDPQHARPDAVFDAVPPAPPQEVREAVDAASKVVQDLAANHRELHFEKDRDTGRLIIQVRDFDGNVLKTIPPSTVLDVMSGKAQV